MEEARQHSNHKKKKETNLKREKGWTHFSKLERKRDKDSGEAALRSREKRKVKRDQEQLKNRAQIVLIV